MTVLGALGFRPFYALAALFAVFAIIYWLLSYYGVAVPQAYLAGVFWHGHEMVYGFAVAVMTGFLLTAVRNWTGLSTPTGWALAALAMLWVLGRILVLTGPALIAAFVDILFLPALLVSVAIPIVRSRNRRNYKILVILALLAVAHVVYHMAFLGSFPSWLNRTSIIVAIEVMVPLLPSALKPAVVWTPCTWWSVAPFTEVYSRSKPDRNDASTARLLWPLTGRAIGALELPSRMP